MKKTIFILSLVLPYFAMALPLPQSKEEFCSRFGPTPSDLEIIQDLSTESSNLMSFKNSGGVFNGGVCWWHSRFQRNIFYLSIFRPDLDRPKTTEGIKAIIHQIRLGIAVVTIPGYRNLEEFSKENKDLIQKELNDWQLYDGVVLGSWVDGLKGNTKVDPDILKNMMKEVFDYVAIKKKIAYEKLQIKGVTAHAWLLVGIKEVPSGFDIGFIDSNSPRMSKMYSYKFGDSSFFVKGYGDFVPYLEFKREEERLVDAGKDFCGVKARDSMALIQSNEKNDKLDLQEAILEGNTQE